jgi:hypothetical protein
LFLKHIIKQYFLILRVIFFQILFYNNLVLIFFSTIKILCAFNYCNIPCFISRTNSYPITLKNTALLPPHNSNRTILEDWRRKTFVNNFNPTVYDMLTGSQEIVPAYFIVCSFLYEFCSLKKYALLESCRKS